MTGKAQEEFQIAEGATLAEFLEEFLRRYPSMEKNIKSLYFAINKKAVTAARSSYIQLLLNEGDEITVGVKIIGG